MSDSPSSESPERITELLAKMKLGDAQAEERFAAVVYQELRRLARRFMRRERPNHSLQTTALLHEAYIRLLGNGPIDWADSSHFFATASQAMRRILVDHARAKRTQRRGAGAGHFSADEHLLPGVRNNWDRILDVDEALGELALVDPRGAKVVELRFFSGLSEEEVSRVLGLSSRTVKRDWRFAQVWLFDRLGESYEGHGGPVSLS